MKKQENNMKPLTEEQLKRVNTAIRETEAKLAKELSYDEDLQYKERINELQEHISKLNNMVKYGWNSPSFK